MQYIQELLTAKRLDIKGILSSPCRISIKEDGSAFQVASEDGHLIFGKRSYSPSKLTKPISDVDLCISAVYYYAYNYLKMYKNIIADYDILNFELISKYENHIIDNSNDDYKIILISAFKDGKSISSKEIKYLAQRLNVSHITYLDANILSSNMVDDIINSDKSEQAVFDIFKNTFNNINMDNIEGLVIEFNVNDKIRTYKIQNPKFLQGLRTHLSDEKNIKTSINAEEIYTKIIDTYNEQNNCKFNGNNKLERLFYLWTDVLQLVKEKELIDKIDSIPTIINFNICEDFIKNEYPILEHIYTLYKNKHAYISLLKFIIMGFQNKRVKNPLWCSLTYQTDILNPFVEKLLD